MFKARVSLSIAAFFICSPWVLAQESTAVLGAVEVSAPKEGALPASAVLTSVDLMGADIVRRHRV